MRAAIIIVIALFAATVVRAQQTGVTGRVTDSSGSVLVGAKVTATIAGGAKIATITNAEGIYQFPALRAADYTVRFESPGFTPAEKTVTVLVGQLITLDLSLRPAATTSTVDVLGSADSVEATSSQVAGNINPAQVSNLPLNGRNWMELSLLVPGVNRNDVGFTPLGSTSGGRFQINVDGQQVTQNSAGDSFGQPQYSRDAMDQFQIITNRFDATLGRSSQMQVNAQTKAGSNDYHGTAYGYFRNDAFNASDPLAHRVLPFSDKQFGGTFGGPIKRDKLWFFGAYEGERQPATLFLQPTGFPGQSFSFDSPLTTNSYLLRTDWQINDAHRLSIRGTGYTWGNPFTGVTGNQHPSRAAARYRTSYSLFGTWTWVKSGSLVNEVKVGWNHFDWDNQAIVPSQEYRLNTITVGGPYNYPQQFIQNTQQYRDDIYWLKGGHSIKGGVEYLYNKHTGFFQQNLRGTVLTFSGDPSNLAAVFPTWNNPSTWNLAALSPLATSFVQGFGDFNIDIPRNTIGTWIQDDWKVSPRLTLNLGLRYDNDIGVFDPSLRLKSGIVTPRSGDNLLFAPRLGFAWDLTGSRKTVVRGGIGIYYADIQANQVIDQQIFNGEASLQPALSSRSGTINLAAPFGSVTGNDFLSGAVPVNAQTVQILAHNAHTPYSLQMSIGAEHQFGRDWNISADFVHWRVYHEWVRNDTNLFYNPATGYNVNPSSAQGRPDPRFVSILTFQTPDAAGAQYDGLQLGIQRRLSAGLTAGLAYTYARQKDSTTGPFYYPNNPFNVADEWANSPDDQRHTLSVNSNYQWKWGLQGSLFYHFGSGQAYQVTAAGNPFNAQVNNRLIAVTARTYNDPANNVAALPGYLEVKRDSLYGRNIHRVDARISKTITIRDRWRVIGVLEAFNLLNHSNYGAYNNIVTAASYSAPSQNANLAYAARMLQLAGRFEF